MRRCLFIDDSSVILKVARRILNGPDLDVSTTESARAGLAMCAANMPDIIVLDATMPDMATADFLAELRGIESAIKPRVVLCMIAFDIGVYMRARRGGAQAYIQKPFNRAQLLGAFREMESATAA